MEPQGSFWARPTNGSPAPESTPPVSPAQTPPPATPTQGPLHSGEGGPWGQVWDNRPPGPPAPPRTATSQFQQPPRPVRWEQAPAHQGPRYGQPAQPTVPAPPRPRRRGTPAIITAVVVGLLVLALAGTGVGVLIGRSWPVADRPRALPPPPATTAPATAPTPAPTEPETQTQTPTPSTLPSPTASTSSSSGRDVYADLPQVVANAIYDLEPQSLECKGLDLPVPEGKRLEPWATKALRCLQDHYAPVVSEAGYTLTTPSLTFFTDDVDTPCGDGATGAFYCAIDEGIYVQRGIYVRDAGRLNTIRMLLHEFSHHVQNRIGVLGDDKYGREPVPVISRRIELQASCWTGMQLRGSQWLGWDQRDEDWLERFNSVDSDKMHGDARSRSHWYDEGRTGTTFAACNTWVADREDVT